MSDIHIVRHRMYYDGFEDYHCKVEYKLGHPRRLADHSDLSFVFFNNVWVLINERDWCTSDDIPGIVERLNQVTGLCGNAVVYAFHCDKGVVLRAEQFAQGGDPYRYPLIDLLTYPPVIN